MFHVNYMEAHAGTTALPSPLITADNKRITTPAEWEEERLKIRQMLIDTMFGAIPPAPEKMRLELRREKTDALDNTAIRREIRVHLENNGRTFYFDMLWYIPKNAARPCPAIVGLNFCGNHGTTDETDVFEEEQEKLQEPAMERGCQQHRWCFREMIGRGFSVATAARNDLFFDSNGGRANSVFSLFHPQEELTAENRSLTAISAWAWGCIRLREILAADPLIDEKRIWVHGHSRLGKTALWASANDEKFAGCVSNDSGCCGAAPSRRNFGETVEVITRTFPWWFQKKMDSFALNETALPFDQNFLLALTAPRPLLVASATEDLWADPYGEFLSTAAADEVWKLYNLGFSETPVFPLPEEPLLGNSLGYYLRFGKHDVTATDWKIVSDFINRY